MLTLTINLRENVADEDMESFISVCNEGWKTTQNIPNIINDIREVLEMSSGAPSLQYVPHRLDKIEKAKGFAPQYLIFLESGSLSGAEEMALWFANRLIERWGGFIDFNGDERYEN